MPRLLSALLLGLVWVGTGEAGDSCRAAVDPKTGFGWVECDDGLRVKSCENPPTGILCYDGQEWHKPSCESRLREAMRAMEEFVNPAVDTDFYDGCNHCRGGQCTLVACSAPNEVAKAEWDLARARERQARSERHYEALKLWRQVKQECGE